MLNQCQFIGNLGRDPEIRTMQNGSPVANLSVGVTEKWKDKNTGERKESTEWVRVVCFQEGLCRVVEQYLSKGSKVYVSGKLQTRKWTDQSGAEKYATEIVLNGFDGKLVMLDSKSDNQGGYQKPASQPDEMVDEIPF